MNSINKKIVFFLSSLYLYYLSFSSFTLKFCRLLPNHANTTIQQKLKLMIFRTWIGWLYMDDLEHLTIFTFTYPLFRHEVR